MGRKAALLAAALLVVPLLAAGTGGVVAAANNTTTTVPTTTTTVPNATVTNTIDTANATNDSEQRKPVLRGVGATLAVRQPHYIDGDVRQESVNGTPRYVVEGEEIRLRPQNFDPDRVLNFGTVEGTAQIGYDRDFGTYQFRPNGTGTYTLFWVVARGGDTVRYTAQVRVVGGVDLAHQTAGELGQLREDAQNYREINETFFQKNLNDPGVPLEQSYQEMLNWYQLHPTNNPLQALTGGAWAYIIMGVTVSGAALIWAIWNGYHTAIVVILKRRLHIHEVAEAEEGDARAAIAELQRQEHQRIAAKTDPRDVHDDDHFGAAMRESLGDNLLSASSDLLARIPGRNLIAHKLQALGQADYTGVRTAADGGADADASVTIRPKNTVSEGADTVDLTAIKPDDDVLEAFDWEAIVRDYDLAELHYDAAAIKLDPDEYDLETHMERFEADLRHFDDIQQWGELFYEFAIAVENHPLTDPDGSLNGPRWVVEGIYTHAEIMGDEYNWPVFPTIREALGGALATYDREEVVQDAIKKAQSGGSAD